MRLKSFVFSLALASSVALAGPKNDIFGPVSFKEELNEFSDSLHAWGTNPYPLLTDERFQIYLNITNLYKTSPEKKARNSYKDEEGKMRHKKFQDAFARYKEVAAIKTKREEFGGFMLAYAPTLDDAQKRYGVPKEIVGAIMGIESDYGKNKGKYHAFNAYASLYLLGEGRLKTWAKKEIKELLEFTKKHKLDVLDLKSSYAGAIGYGQFIPSSLNAFFLGKEVYDMDTCIHSTANYLAKAKERLGSLDAAILDYNRDSCYFEAVKEIAREKY